MRQGERESLRNTPGFKGTVEELRSSKAEIRKGLTEVVLPFQSVFSLLDCYFVMDVIRVFLFLAGRRTAAKVGRGPFQFVMRRLAGEVSPGQRHGTTRQ